MEDKNIRQQLNRSNENLQFTKENRHEVFQKIRKLENNTIQKKIPVSLKKIMPATVSLFIVGLCLFLFMPSLVPGNVSEQSMNHLVNNETNSSGASPVVEEKELITTLITVKSKEMDNRAYVNLLLTYNQQKKLMKVASLPTDTYVAVAEKDDGTIMYDKLLFAYQFGGAENVKVAASKLFDLPIDYYAVIDLETVSAVIDAVNGITYDLKEDMRLRAVSQVAFEFKKGMNFLNGEQVVSLMMAATEGRILDEANLINLINIVMNKTANEISAVQLKQLFAHIETNASLDILVDNLLEIQLMESVSLSDGMVSGHIEISSTEGKHIYEFEKDFLNTVSEELTTFN